MRLNKYLARCGVCSRRDADKLIERGEVLVNGTQATYVRLVGDGDEVLVSGRRVQAGQERVVLAFYKPLGVTCTERDAHAERIVSDLIDYPVRVTYAGRLDKDSEGLLLLSNDGDLIQTMMKGANRHEKEYLVRVNKEITPEFLERMSRGVYLEELDITTRECEVKKQDKFVLRMVLSQGVNRQIKRMCRACGYHVRSLKRIRVMHVTLGDLKPGEYRELGSADVERLYRDCGLKRQA
ncbi:MAG: pseudouridine synthase [Lachnospiraceae bacterium]|nr:pseudouridine synthase [Lachnospiraceae bacterium]